MTTYFIRRLIQSAIIILLISLIVFLTMRLVPGDPIYMFIPANEFNSSTPEKIAEMRHEFGLDKPIMAQYFDWLSGVVRGDLGISILGHDSVAERIGQRLPITLYLGLVAFTFGTVLGALLGAIAAVRRGRWADNLITVMANIGITVPGFFLGILLIFVLAVHFRLLPVGGYTSPFENFGMNIKQMIMPAACLSLFPMASTARQMRSAMLEVIHQDYIRTARSKGLAEWVVVMRHAIKNALVPVITLSGVSFRNIVGGSVLIESVFSIPGMGRLAVSSILDKDYAIVQGVVLVISIAVVLVNLLVDLSYGWIDPRVHYE
jgi:peptide/nickel transport system permease protein